VNELLVALDDLVVELATGAPIKILMERARADFEVGVETLFSGILSSAIDAMRDVMEIELLLLDFTATPENADRWLHADNTERWNKFRPGAIRKRLTAWGRISANSADYEAHSATLHPSPIRGPFMARGLRSDQRETFGVDAGFWELFGHAGALLRALVPYLATIGRSDLQDRLSPEALPMFSDAFDRTREMQEIYLAMLQAAVDTRREESEREDDS